jgi:hypothetical protein
MVLGEVNFRSALFSVATFSYEKKRNLIGDAHMLAKATVTIGRVYPKPTID